MKNEDEGTDPSPRLIERFRENPDISFAVEADLPGGRTARIILGPMINGNLAAKCDMPKPVSDADLEFISGMMDWLVGQTAAHVLTARNTEERKNVAKTFRHFFGGGKG